MPDPSPSLDELRAAIDQIDRDWIALLDKRAEIVRSVAALKARDQSPVFFPAIEARRLQRLLQSRSNNTNAPSGLSPTTLAVLLGQMMTAMGHMQKTPHIAVASPPAGSPLIDSIRTQWGSFATIARTHTDAAALSLVLEGKATHAVLPWIGGDHDQLWWDGLTPPLFVVAMVPFITPSGISLADTACGLVVMKRSYDPSLTDRSLIRIRTDADLTRDRLMEGASAAGLAPLRLISHRLPGTGRSGRAVHCLECAGYIAANDTRLSILRLSFEAETEITLIGGYPVIAPPDEGP